MVLARNPLDYFVEEIVKAPQYLTAAHKTALSALVGVEEASLAKAPSLKAQLERQLRMLQKLEHLSSSSTDIGEVKRVMDAARDLYNLIAKFQTAVAAEERTNAIFESVRITFEDLNDDALTAQFLAAYKAKIGEIDRRNGEL